MTPRILSRLGRLVFVLWVVATLTFFLFRLMPGDPTLNFITPTFDDATRAALMHNFGLDRPLGVQYLIYMRNLLTGDLGRVVPAGPAGDDDPAAGVAEHAHPDAGFDLRRLSDRRSRRRLPRVRPRLRRSRRPRSRPRSPCAPRPNSGSAMLMLAAFAFQLGWFPTGGAASPGSGHGAARATGCSPPITGGICACRR